MTDIKPWGPGEGPQRYIRELEAEIERLRALVRDISATRDTAVNMKLERDAEIVRLRQTINDQAQLIERLTRP